jgi:class 3 adenylate cyclase
MENRLMTIMFLDMQGYTKKSARQSIEEMKLFHDQMFKFVSDIIDKWNGKMVKSLGDGFLVRFESPTNAVQAGTEVQRKLETRNAQILNPDSLVRFRIGINTGEVGVDENGDLFGDPVNIASRIQTFADTNDVFISESTYLAMNQNEFGAVDLGAQALKNATREIRIYKVLKSGRPAFSADANKDGFFGKRKKVFAVIFLIFFLVFVVIFIRKKIRSLRERKTTVNTETVEAQPDKDSKASKKTAGPEASQADNEKADEDKTLLEFSDNVARLRLTLKERNVFNNIKSLVAQKDFLSAEKLAAKMLYKDQVKFKKIFWSLIFAEVLWIQGKKDKVLKLQENVLKKAKLPKIEMKKLYKRFSQLRKKYNN